MFLVLLGALGIATRSDELDMQTARLLARTVLRAEPFLRRLQGPTYQQLRLVAIVRTPLFCPFKESRVLARPCKVGNERRLELAECPAERVSLGEENEIKLS